MPINGPFPLPSKVATKADVGLANVDNTPDSSKPVSGPQQTALDGKANSVHTHAPADITALVEFIQDTVAAFLSAGANVTLTYDDSGNVLTIAATGGGGGGGLADGNYGDVTVSSGGTVITINSGAVGLAEVTGLVDALDDKVDVVNPVSTGIAQHTGAFNLPTTSPGGAVLESDAGGREYSFSASGAFTINATPPDGRVFGPVGVSNTDINPITRTLPVVSGLTWVNDNTGLEITEIEIRGNNRIEFLVRRLGTQLRVVGLPVAGEGEPLPAVLQGIADLTPSEGDLLQWQSGAWALLPFSNLVASVAAELDIDTVPGAFTAGMWTVTDTTNGGEIEVDVSSLPPDGGSAITAIEYRLDAGTWTAFSPALSTTGARTISSLTNDQQYDVELRAVNAIGNGAASDTKQVTPTAASGGDLTFVQASAQRDDFSSDLTLTFASPSTIGNHILAAFAISDEARTVSGTGASVDASPVASTGNRAWALRTPSVADAVTTRAYTLSSGWTFSGIALEVSGAAPVFDDDFVVADTTFDASVRTININVAQDNSFVLIIATQQAEREMTLSAGLTGINTSPGAYSFAAYGKFGAGAHALTLTPSGTTQFNTLVAFVWSPGA